MIKIFNSINPPPLKRNKFKIYKNITVFDFVLLLFAMICSIITIFSVYKYVFFIWTIVIGFTPVFICGILIVPVGTHEKIYHWLFYSLYFPLTKKKYKEKMKKLLIPYDKVEKGYIKLKDGYAVGVIKVKGFNYMTLTETEAHNVLESYRYFLRQINLPYSIVSADMKISYESNKKIIENINFSHNKKIKGISKNILNNVEKYQNPDEKSFYIMIYSSEEDLKKKMPYFEKNLSDANLTINRVTEDKELLLLISKFYLNNNIVNDFNELINGKTKFHRNHIKMNNKYLRVVSLDKLPFQSNLGWIYPLTQIKGATFIMNIEGYRISKAIKKVARGQWGSTFRASEEAEANIQIDLLMQLSDQIKRESETLLTTNQYLLLKADSKKELDKIEQEVRDMFMANGFFMDALYFR